MCNPVCYIADEIEQDLTETQEDNVNLQVLLERAVKSQKESDVFATQAIRSIHSDLNLVSRAIHAFICLVSHTYCYCY
jgi:hypothetical protein